MKVLFVASGKSGNVNAIVSNQGESLRKAGVDVEYYVLRGHGIKGYLRNIRPLARIIHAEHYDVVHAHYAWCGYVASLAGAKPLIVSLMGNDILDHSWYPLLARVFRCLFRWSATIVKSQEMRQRVGIKEAIVVPNGVNMDVFKELDKTHCQQQLGWSSDKKHVLFLGRHDDARKNLPLAQAAVNQLTADGMPIELHCLEGYRNNETPVVYNAADAAILPSFYEGSANALKEAMACGVPVVATPCGDAVERLQNITGSFASNSYDISEVVALLRQSLGFNGKTNGRKRLEEDNLGSQQVANRLISIYNQTK